MINDYVVIDLETTGLDVSKERIIEIGMVKVRGGEAAFTYSRFVNPGKRLPSRISELTGIVEADLAGAPYIDELLPEIFDFIGNDILVGHQLIFDYSFLKRDFVNAGYAFERKGIDTLKLARTFLTECSSKKLHDITTYYGMEHCGHRALNDAMATFEIYERISHEFCNEGNEKCFMPKELIFKVKKRRPITKRQIDRLNELIKKHDIDFEYEIEKLSKNEADREIDIIYSQFGHDSSRQVIK